MKNTLKKLIIVAFGLQFFNAIALSETTSYLTPSYLECSNGTLEEVGESLTHIFIYEDGIEFSLYETEFSVDAELIEYSSGRFVINNQLVSIDSEGIAWESEINAMLLLREDLTLHVALNLEPQRGFVAIDLKCERR